MFRISQFLALRVFGARYVPGLIGDRLCGRFGIPDRPFDSISSDTPANKTVDDRFLRIDLAAFLIYLASANLTLTHDRNNLKLSKFGCAETTMV